MRITIGTAIAIQSAGRSIIGLISEVTSSASSGIEMSSQRAIANVDLIGEIGPDDTGSRRFLRGVRYYPAIGDRAVPLSAQELRLIYASPQESSIVVGQLNQDLAIPVHVNADELLAKHFAVLGSTGVGKSSGVAVIIDELTKARPDVRVLLLDVHNEYGNCFPDRSKAIGSDELRLPFWLLTFEEITDVIYGGKPAVAEETEILLELIPTAKAHYQSYKGSQDRSSILSRKNPKAAGFTADTPSPYLMHDLLGLIDERMGKLENRSTRMIHHRLMMRIEALIQDKRFAFMFENANVGGDTMAAVLGQLFHVDSDDCSITILKLASLPGEVIDAIVCVTARLAFEFGQWSNGGVPLMLVCEEAHRYAAADRSVGFAPARRALSKIAKEGRKYGVHLGLVTQRPAELDPTIISQCSTLFFMRMANDQDQRILQAAVSDTAENLLPFIPTLGTGEAVGIGEGLPVPTRFSFTLRAPAELPFNDQSRASRSPALDRIELVRQAVERWRQSSISQPNWRDQHKAAAQSPLASERKSALALGLQTISNERVGGGDTVTEYHNRLTSR
ncbi:MAG: DUF87 domain-containing protein [Rhizobiaceae bacterium]